MFGVHAADAVRTGLSEPTCCDLHCIALARTIRAWAISGRGGFPMPRASS
jgi:hypothetical protein